MLKVGADIFIGAIILVAIFAAVCSVGPFVARKVINWWNKMY